TNWPCCAARDARPHHEWERPVVSAGQTIARFVGSCACFCLSEQSICFGGGGQFALDGNQLVPCRARQLVPEKRGGWRSRSRQFASLDRNHTVLHLVRILEQPALRRARSARTVAIVRSAVAGAHEQTRLRKPPDWAAEVRAINRKNLELLSFDAPHPTRGLHSLAVGRRDVGISKHGEARLTFRELADVAERNPGKVGTCASPRNRREQEAHNRYREGSCHHAVEEHPDLHE